MLSIHTLGNETLDCVGSSTFGITEVRTVGKRMSIAEIEISKRYPLAGWNKLPNDMIATILGGRARLHTTNSVYEMGFGSVIEIPEGTDYFWECLTLQVRLLAINSPPFEKKDRKS